MSKKKVILAAGALTAAVLSIAPAAAGASASNRTPTVVVHGLNNPRQLSLVGGQLLIAEAGMGGTTEVSSDEGPEYVGYTGSVSQVSDPATGSGESPNRVVTGLLSAAGSPDGSFAVGSDGVSARRVAGPIFIQETYAPPDVLPAPPGTAQDGKLLVARNGVLSQRADITAFEAANDPDGQGFDSNPYAVLALPGGGELVADAAANDVLRVTGSTVSVFHVFPNITDDGKCARNSDGGQPGCNYVPDSLARDSAGNIYVGGLGSEVAQAGRVTELSPDGSTVLNVYRKFHSVTGVAVGRNGSLYVSQLEAAEQHPPFPGIEGVLTKVSHDGSRIDVDVPFPAGVAVDSSNDVYVSAWSVSSATGLAGPGTDGQVWRLHF